MPEQARDPTARHKYLGKADYYRLAYQLCAQLMNGEHHAQQKDGGAFWFLHALASAPPPRDAPMRASARARIVAEGFLKEVGEVSAWYEQRHRAKWWTRQVFPKLKQKELRLEKFLTCTVGPCLDLVVAASLRSDGDISGAEGRVVRLREKAAEKEPEVSYRTLYNLACYEAGSGNDEGITKALRYLEQALREAPPDRQEELAGWAEKDPSLRGLSENGRFKELLARSLPEDSAKD